MPLPLGSVYIAVHGGAGRHSTKDEDVKAIRRGMKKACTEAWKASQNTELSTLPILVEAVCSLEDNKDFNAGYGSNLTLDGTAECDAAIMNQGGEFASVGGVAGIKNPIRAAYALLEHSRNADILGRIPPTTLVCAGARSFVESLGRLQDQLVPADSLISEKAQREWTKWKSRLNSKTPSYPEGEMQDTVGAIVMTDTDTAAAVSSGGILLKLPGRMGEAAVFGAGCWAQHSEKRKITCSVSGTGEEIVRAALSRTICERFIQSDDEDESLHEIMESVIDGVRATRHRQYKDNPFNVGVLAIACSTDGSPRLWCAFTTPSMAIGYLSSNDPKPKTGNNTHKNRRTALFEHLHYFNKHLDR